MPPKSVRVREVPLTVVPTEVTKGPPWTFYCRMDRGADVIDEWYMKLQVKARARFTRALDQLRERPLKDWTRPLASSLGDHIYVIRFKDHSSLPHRVFGHFVGDRAAFVMTVTAIEKDYAYIPSNCKDQADRYREIISNDFAKHVRVCHNGHI